MKTKKPILIGIIIVVVIVAGYFIFQDKQKTQPTSNQQPTSNALSKENQEIRLCEKHKSGPELSAEDLYCAGFKCLNACDENGENCHKVIDKEECGKLDVITTDDNNEFIGFGNDGDPDCGWDPTSGCRPNK